MGYTKLHEGLISSSMWDEDKDTKILWITMLAMKDMHHRVRGTLHWLAMAARLTDEECQASLAKLTNPDHKSLSREFDGRRVEQVEGGWLILNGEKYRAMLSPQERNEYKALKQAEYRLRKKDLRTAAERDGAVAALQEGFKREEADLAT